jgi:hypothetical protein
MWQHVYTLPPFKKFVPHDKNKDVKKIKSENESKNGVQASTLKTLWESYVHGGSKVRKFNKPRHEPDKRELLECELHLV